MTRFKEKRGDSFRWELNNVLCMKLSFGRCVALEDCPEFGIRRGDIAWFSGLISWMAVIREVA